MEKGKDGHRGKEGGRDKVEGKKGKGKGKEEGKGKGNGTRVKGQEEFLSVIITKVLPKDEYNFTAMILFPST